MKRLALVGLALALPATAISDEHWFDNLLAMARPGGADDGAWFEALKDAGDDELLYRALHYMPKGGDLHNHNSGSSYPEDWLRVALAQEDRGYVYYTKTRIENCRDYDKAGFPYLLLFRNIVAAEYETLSDCEKSEYTRLDQLDDEQKEGWLNSIMLDKPSEGREEFFGTHWQRLNALWENPHIRADLLVNNMELLKADNGLYLETQIGLRGARRPDGQPISNDEVMDIFRARLAQPDALATGITVRVQLALLRFVPSAEDDLRELYAAGARHSDLIVAMNMVGREDNDFGYPRRFLPVLREMRQKYDLRLSIHAGEVDEPNAHVRDTLLLGADRIGHGINLITDDETMLDMRNGPYLVEINLISNLLLGYVVDYSQHPFPEYLRTDIPVALSTDDRGMWDSTLSDEFYVAVREFDLTWDEIKLLGRNSLEYAFVEPAVKQKLIAEYERNIGKFERQMQSGNLAKLGEMPETRGFICARYQLCN
ncbi:MAG: adenosine deaminase [Pseudomonadota bacterium]